LEISKKLLKIIWELRVWGPHAVGAQGWEV